MTGWVARFAIRFLPRTYRERFGEDLRREWSSLRLQARRDWGWRGEWRYVIREVGAFARLVCDTHSARWADEPRWSWSADGRATWRHLGHRPGRLAGASLMLGTALTAATVAFAVVDAVLWRDLPFRDADRLVAVWEQTGPIEARQAGRVTGYRFVDWTERATTLQDLAAFGAAGFQVETGDGVATVRGVRVSGHFFETLGVVPAAGRVFTRADQVVGAPRVVVLSHGYWQSRFAGRAAVIGDTLILSGQAHTIIGVLPDVWLPSWPVNPATIQLDPAHRQLWVPLPPGPTLAQNTGSHLLGVIGRLAPGQSAETAGQELERLAASDQPDPHAGVVRPLRDQMVLQARAPMYVLFGAACCVLLVACLNLAAIDFASVESRIEEFRVRTALGAGSGRLARQLLIESIPVVGAATMLAVGLSHVILTTVSATLGTRVPLLTAPHLDGPAMAVLATLAGLAGCIITAWPIRRVRALGRLHTHGDRRVSASNSPVFRALVIGQLTGAVALVLLSTVLVQSFMTIGARDPGFDPADVHVLEISLPRVRYTVPATIVSAEKQLQERLGAAPGVLAATLSHDHPFEANWLDVVTLVGQESLGVMQGDARTQAHLRIVAPNYVEAMSARLVDGRSFAPGVEPGHDGQVLVNEAFVQRDGANVGRQLRLSSPRGTWGAAVPGTFTIVGILQDERFLGLETESEPAVYVSTRQFPQTDLSILVRVRAGRTPTTADLRAVVRAVEPQASLGTVRALSAIEAGQRAPRTLMTMLIGAFAAGTLVLAATGLYAMLTLLVTARRRDIAVRIALGATPRVIARQAAWLAGMPIAAGTVLGLSLAALGAWAMRAVLPEASTITPATMAIVAAVMMVAGACAALVPVRRSRRTDAAVLLR
jgi:putative ABC transport system permease protein